MNEALSDIFGQATDMLNDRLAVGGTSEGAKRAQHPTGESHRC